jgi:hypothetical protein
MKAQYHFLTGPKTPAGGGVAVTKEFEGANKAECDAKAIAFGKNKKGVIRVQCDETRKHIYENVPTTNPIAVDAEALLDVAPAAPAE